MNECVIQYKIGVLQGQTYKRDRKVSMCIEIVENTKSKIDPPTTHTTPCLRCRALGSGVDPMVSIPCRQLASSHT